MDETELNKLQEEFIKDAFFRSAWLDTSQHVKIYKKEADENTKKQFRAFLKERSYEIVKLYQDKDEKIDHQELLVKFHKEVTEKSEFKGKIKFKFGRAQKLINVLLKYYWCAGKLKQEPAHMPLDRYILNALGKKDKWTDMEEEAYKECIDEAREKAKGMSLAEWELKTFTSKNDEGAPKN